ncbi:MAG: hypothetical protein II165_03320 [Bacteroidales bacterium]|nr:hypothetical protein [Bacteroidales bacterium]
MKKFFLFAAAAVAALTVNAKVVTFSGIVDKTSAETAKSTFEAAFNLSNITVAGKPNSKGDAYYAELTQTSGTEEWGLSTAKLKSDAQVYFDFKDKSDNKVVMKYWADYAQPNGKAVCLVISGLNVGDEVTINLKEALSKETQIEGATEASNMFASTAVKLTAMANEIRVYSRNVAGDADAKWKLASVEVPEGSQAVDNVFDNAKAVKTFENGQLVIIKNGVKFNALGAQL